MKARLAILLTLGVGTASLSRGQETALDRGRQLFSESRWREARDVLEEELARDDLAGGERNQARLFVGLSYVNEAEFYRGLTLFATQVGLEYMAELAESEANRDTKWLPLFRGIYQLSAGDAVQAEQSLQAALAMSLPDEWTANAKMRLSVARARSGKSGEGARLDGATSHQARYYRAVIAGSRPDVALLEALAEVDLDAPDVEEGTDEDKVLKFYDPIRLEALEGIAWERAVEALRPLTVEGDATANKFARFYAGMSLFFLGATEEASELLAPIDAAALGPDFHQRALLLRAAASWKAEAPGDDELGRLWQASSPYPKAVLLWHALERPELSSREPFATKIADRLAWLPDSWGARPDKTIIGPWGLAALESGIDASEVLRTLSGHRNHANKNKIEFNEPLLLIALCAANYENNDYAQALETLFELSKTYDGLRGLQWNLQGVYAARQKAAGDARIAN